MAKALVLNVGNPIFRGMTTLKPYVIEKKVPPVDHISVVQYVHNTYNNSSTHLPFASSNLFFSPFTMTFHGFSLSVTLRVSRSIIFVSNAQFTIIPLENFTIKLEPVVQDQCVQNSKFGDNVFLDKLLCILISDVGERLSLDPFREVINSNKQPSSISSRPWERTNYI